MGEEGISERIAHGPAEAVLAQQDSSLDRAWFLRGQADHPRTTRITRSRKSAKQTARNTHGSKIRTPPHEGQYPADRASVLRPAFKLFHGETSALVSGYTPGSEMRARPRAACGRVPCHAVAPCSDRHFQRATGALLSGFRFFASSSGCQTQLFWRLAAQALSQARQSPPRVKFGAPARVLVVRPCRAWRSCARRRRAFRVWFKTAELHKARRQPDTKIQNQASEPVTGLVPGSDLG